MELAVGRLEWAILIEQSFENALQFRNVLLEVARRRSRLLQRTHFSKTVAGYAVDLGFDQAFIVALIEAEGLFV